MFRSRTALAATLFLVLSPVQASEPLFANDKLAKTMLEHVIRPGYRELVVAARAMQDKIEQSCAGKARDDAALRKAFSKLVLAWGRIEPVGFGAVVEQNRLERILFWPDRQGIGARQIDKLLRSPETITSDRLSFRSVAVQGLGAMERVLFTATARNAAGQNRADRCQLAVAIAGNLLGIAEDLDGEWSPTGEHARLWLAPGTKNRLYFRPEETTAAIAKAFHQGLTRLLDERIGGPLGEQTSSRHAAPVLGTSGMTLTLVQGNLEGLSRIFTKGGLYATSATVMAAKGMTHVDGSDADTIGQELSRGAAEAKALSEESDPFNRKEIRHRLLALRYPVRNARDQAAALLAATAGLTLGFNASDGD